MSKKKVSTNWYLHYRDSFEWYPSQQAALDAADPIVSTYESGIWSEDRPYFHLGCEPGETIDCDLFNSRFSAKSLVVASADRMFRVDIFVKNKEDWIFRYGSDLLKQSTLAGYDYNDGYLEERLAHEYPDFKMNSGKYKKVDTPKEKCLQACLGYKYAHCSSSKDDYYITVDNFLGKYQLIKLIDFSIKTTHLFALTEINEDLQEWVRKHGSDLLQQSLMAGYDCKARDLNERLAYDYPGFEINTGKYQRTDSPDEEYLYACLGYENSYCSSSKGSYYITIDNFLGEYQLIKPIDAFVKVNDNLSGFNRLISSIDLFKPDRDSDKLIKE